MTPTRTRTKAEPTTRRNPGGRPSPIDVIVGHHPETGDPITVSDRIVSSLRAGNYFEPACMAAGVAKDTAYEWLKVAGRLRIRARGLPLVDLNPAPTAHEERCLKFSDAVDEAQALWEVGANTTLEQLARGGLKTTTVTEKHDAAGNLIERTTRTETLAPNAQVIEWRLTRKNRHRYGDKIDVDSHVEGAVVLSIEERANVLADGLEAYLQGVDDAKTKR